MTRGDTSVFGIKNKKYHSQTLYEREKQIFTQKRIIGPSVGLHGNLNIL